MAKKEDVIAQIRIVSLEGSKDYEKTINEALREMAEVFIVNVELKYTNSLGTFALILYKEKNRSR